MTVILAMPPKAKLKIWEWLRQVADKLEKENCDNADDFAVLVTVHYVDDEFRLRAERSGATVLEAIGALTIAAHDYLNVDNQ